MVCKPQDAPALCLASHSITKLMPSIKRVLPKLFGRRFPLERDDPCIMLPSGDLPSVLTISCATYGRPLALVDMHQSHTSSGRATHGSFPSAVPAVTVRFSFPTFLGSSPTLRFCRIGLNHPPIGPENTLYRYVMRVHHGRIHVLPGSARDLDMSSPSKVPRAKLRSANAPMGFL